MDVFTIIAQLINFTVLIYLLNKFLYKPILSALDKRRSDVKKKIEDTEKKLNETEKIKETYLKKLGELEQENVVLKEKASQEINKFKETEMQKAKDDVAIKKDKLDEYLKFEQKKMMENFNENFEELFVQYSNMILKNIANSNLQQEIVNKFIENVNILTLKKTEEINLLKPDTIFIKSSGELNLDQQKEIKNTLENKKIKFSNLKFDVDKSLILGIEMRAKSYVLSWDMREMTNEFLNSINKK